MKFVAEPVDYNSLDNDDRLIHALFNSRVNDTPAIEVLWHIYNLQCVSDPLN